VSVNLSSLKWLESIFRGCTSLAEITMYRKGFVFVGWYEKAMGSIYTVQEVIENESSRIPLWDAWSFE